MFSLTPQPSTIAVWGLRSPHPGVRLGRDPLGFAFLLDGSLQRVVPFRSWSWPLLMTCYLDIYVVEPLNFYFFLLYYNTITLFLLPFLPFKVSHIPHLTLSNLWPIFSWTGITYVCIYAYIPKCINTCSVCMLRVCMFTDNITWYWTITLFFPGEDCFPRSWHPSLSGVLCEGSGPKGTPCPVHISMSTVSSLFSSCLGSHKTCSMRGKSRLALGHLANYPALVQ